MRSYLGAAVNALESKIQYLGVAGENNEASRSRIRDVDLAKESSDLVKNQILQQSSAAMLQQANQTPNIALDLLP
jgi:flagellin